MTFANIPRGIDLFLDANILAYYFTAHPVFAATCVRLVERIERQELTAFTSTHVLSEVAHRVMNVEAASMFGWTGKVTQRLKKQPALLQQLTRFEAAVQDVLGSRIRILTIAPLLAGAAAGVSRRMGLLGNDALIVALMQQHGLTHLASNDSDFDRVPGLTRYAPV